MKFPYEKYLHFFPSHLLPEQLRCFPRSATFLLLLQPGGMAMDKSEALVLLSPFLSWAIDILGWHNACFGNTPSSALFDVNNSIISSSLHHFLISPSFPDHIDTQQSSSPKLPCFSAPFLPKISPKGARPPIL